MATTQVCTHLELIRNPKPKTKGCEECLKMGDTWVHLRLCEVCGHVGCCDSSKNKHATKHFHATGHPIVKPLERGENWVDCYIENAPPRGGAGSAAPGGGGRPGTGAIPGSPTSPTGSGSGPVAREVHKRRST